MNKKYVFDPYFKDNICQNFRIARSLIKMNINDAAYYFECTVDHLKRIEAPHDRSNISLNLVYMGSVVYQQEPNFFFIDWKENQKILDKMNKQQN